MVETLGPSVLPYLPKALEQLLADSEVYQNLQTHLRLFSYLLLLNLQNNS